MADAGIQLLSDRGKQCAQGAPSGLVWKVSADLYDREHNPNGYVNVGIAENSLMHDEFRELALDKFSIEKAAFTYGNGPFGSRRVRNAIARFLNRHLKPVKPLEYSDLIVTNGTSHSIEHCAWGLANEGEGILLGRPYYRSFLRDLQLRPGAKVIEVAFNDVDPMAIEAVKQYEHEIVAAQKRGQRVAALMLCNPHNPLGRVYSRETIISYLILCQKYKVHFISDEIYALSVFKNAVDHGPAPVDFVSVLSIEIEQYIDPALVHVLWGMSKDFGANGLRLGCIVSQSNAAFLSALETIAIFSSPSSVSEHVTCNVLEDDSWTAKYIQENQKRMSSAYSFTVSFLQNNNIGYAPGANAAFFVWMDLGKAYLKRHPERKDASDLNKEIEDLLLKEKVFIGNGSIYGSETVGMFRFTFTHPQVFIEEALRRMLKALEVGFDGQTRAQ